MTNKHNKTELSHLSESREAERRRRLSLLQMQSIEDAALYNNGPASLYFLFFFFLLSIFFLTLSHFYFPLCSHQSFPPCGRSAQSAELVGLRTNWATCPCWTCFPLAALPPSRSDSASRHSPELLHFPHVAP